MLLYLDMCSIQRPLDDKVQPRLAVESEAVLALLKLCETGRAELVSSSPLAYETRRNPHPIRKDHALGVLRKAGRVVRLSASIVRRAAELEGHGLKPLDSLHLACAIDVSADYLVTCDDRLLKRAKAVVQGPPRLVNPLELIAELEP
jgi:predicted nucleic acid-binding protein